MNASIIRRQRLTHAVAAMTVKTLLGLAMPDAFARPDAEILTQASDTDTLQILPKTPNERKQKHDGIH